MTFHPFCLGRVQPAIGPAERPSDFLTRGRGLRSGLALTLALATPLGAAAQAPASMSAPAVGGKVTADDAEYAAALALDDPTAQGAALNAFVVKHPASPLKHEALEKAMAAYLVARDLDKVDAVSSRILSSDPDDARALAMAVYVLRARYTTAADDKAPALAEKAGADAERGLAALSRWRPEAGASEIDADAVRSEMAAVFRGALGDRAMARKDLDGAKADYLAAVHADPSGLTDVYHLAVAMLDQTPPDPAGFWWAARAEDLAASAGDRDAQVRIEADAKTRYGRYHGDDGDWGAVLAAANTGLAPPPDFTVKAAPTPASVAVQAVRDAPIADLSFSDWEFILAQRDASVDNRVAADKVWANITGLQSRGARMKFKIKVIGVGPDGIDGAITDDNQQSARADLHVKLSGPPPRMTAGTMISVSGVLTAYTPRPFAFTMEQAEIGPS